MLLIAIPLSPPDHADSLKRRQAGLDAKLALYHKSKINHIQSLPAELLTSIGHHLAETDADVALVLAGVSRQWRSLFLDDAKVWSTLKISRRRGLPKAQAYWERSKGMLVSLEMNGLSVEQGGKVLELVQPSFERLVSLHWTIDVGQSTARVESHLTRWQGRFTRLRHLRIQYLPGGANPAVQTMLEASPVWSLLGATCVLDSLALCNVQLFGLPPPAKLGPISSLRHLDFTSLTLPRHASSDMDLSHFLDLVPDLETLVLAGASGPFICHPDHRTHPVLLSSLRRLNVSKSRLSSAMDLALVTPVLERADLSQISGQAWWRALLPLDPTTGQISTANVGRLTHLNLTRSSIEEDPLLHSLGLIPTLTHLYLASSNLTNKVFEGLVLSSSGEGVAPALEHLDMSYSESVTGGPVCRMVASRKGYGREGKGLRSLVLDGCPVIELKAVEWLMGKVDKVSCKVVLEKKKR